MYASGMLPAQLQQYFAVASLLGFVLTVLPTLAVPWGMRTLLCQEAENHVELLWHRNFLDS